MNVTLANRKADYYQALENGNMELAAKLAAEIETLLAA